MKKMMLRNLILAFFSSLFFMQVVAQNTKSSDLKPEDMRKLLEQQKKEIEADQDMDPEEKANLLKMMNSKTVKDVIKKMDHPGSKMTAAFKLDEKMTSLPKLDLKRLSTIPKKTFTTSQLDQYVNHLAEKIKSQLSTEDKSEVQKIISGAKMNSSALSSVGVVAWYNGHPKQGLLIAARSVQKEDNADALNNFGSMLIQAGYEEKAVPLLQYALKKDSVNPSILNNLGRAWLGLGEKKKAKQFFLSCIGRAPNHPEANNSLGCLYEEEGNKEEAIQHFEKSLEGDYNENACEHLSKLKPDFDLPKLVKFHHKPPKYFDQFNIKVPGECTDVTQVDSIRLIHEAFRNGLGNLESEYAVFEKQSQDKMHAAGKQIQKSLINALDNGSYFKVTVAPFELLATNMIIKLNGGFIDESILADSDYARNYRMLLNDYYKSASEIAAHYDSLEMTCIFEGEGGINEEEKWERYVKEDCNVQLKNSNKYQRDAATLHAAFSLRYRRLALDACNSLIFWSGMLTTFPGEANAAVYGTMKYYIDQLEHISSNTPYLNKPACIADKHDNEKLRDDEFPVKKKPDCPFSLNIPIVIGKISLDCSSFSISGGEGIVAGYKKDFTNGQSTISVGAGVGVDVGTGGVHGGVKAGETIYITFNGDGGFSDVGMKMDVGGEVQIGAAGTGASAGYTMGMNSGFNFTHSGMENSITL